MTEAKKVHHISEAQRKVLDMLSKAADRQGSTYGALSEGRLGRYLRTALWLCDAGLARSWRERDEDWRWGRERWFEITNAGRDALAEANALFEGKEERKRRKIAVAAEAPLTDAMRSALRQIAAFDEEFPWQSPIAQHILDVLRAKGLVEEVALRGKVFYCATAEGRAESRR